MPKSSKKAALPEKLLIEPQAQWYNDLASLPASELPTPTPAQLSSLFERAAALHSNAVEAYQTRHASSAANASSEAGFLNNIAQSGTLSDRLSALTLIVQSSPLHNVNALESLKSMAERGKGKGGREESLKALRCIVDWWTGGGAPSRKLR
jgi:ribosome biogenesis protein MAK21